MGRRLQGRRLRLGKRRRVEVVAQSASGLAVIDAPALLVDKRTGKLTEVYGLEWRDPVAGLVTIGNPSD